MSVSKRPLLTGVAVAALLAPVGGTVLGALPPGATTTPINGTGVISGCAVTGSVKFPKGPTSGSFDAKVAISFTGSSGGTIATTIKKGAVKGTLVFTPTDASCVVTPYSMTGSLTVSYKVKTGSTPHNPSTVQFNQIRTFTGTPSEGTITGVVTSGSFYTDGSYLTMYPPTGSAGCVNKRKPGSGSSFELG